MKLKMISGQQVFEGESETRYNQEEMTILARGSIRSRVPLMTFDRVSGFEAQAITALMIEGRELEIEIDGMNIGHGTINWFSVPLEGSLSPDQITMTVIQRPVREFTGTRFIKRRIEVQAFQWFGDHRQTEDPSWLWEARDKAVISYAGGRMKIRTLEGDMEAGPGDWIIKGVEGEIYPCKDQIFRKTYEPA